MALECAAGRLRPTHPPRPALQVVCPIKSAWDLHRAWPEAEFVVIPDAGHSAFEEGIQTALLNACDAFGKAV